MTLRLLVCGGRDFTDKPALFRTLDQICAKDSPADITIIHGAAKGADSLAADWAAFKGASAEAYPANWREHGRSAGPRRNKLMLEMGQPDMVVAFPGGRGTANMVAQARKAGVPIWHQVKSA